MSGWALDVFVPGKPAAQGSKRHVGNGILVEQSKAVAPWRTSVAWHASQAMHAAQDMPAPLTGALVVELEFVMPRPTSAPKRSTPHAVKRPDIDKMQRAIFDALTGICWLDDSQVIGVSASKRLGEPGEGPGCAIRVGELAAVGVSNKTNIPGGTPDLGDGGSDALPARASVAMAHPVPLQPDENSYNPSGGAA